MTLVLAHTALADQGMFAHRLADHPNVLYDTSCFSPLDLVELFARVPAERIVFAFDVPYGRPVGGLYAAMRVARLAGLDASDRALSPAGRWPRARWPHAGADSTAAAGQGALAQRHASTCRRVPADGIRGGESRRPTPRRHPMRSMDRPRSLRVSRPRPGPAGPALARIDSALRTAERLLTQPPPLSLSAFGLLHGAAVIAATEPVETPVEDMTGAATSAPSRRPAGEYNRPAGGHVSTGREVIRVLSSWLGRV